MNTQRIQHTILKILRKNVSIWDAIQNGELIAEAFFEDIQDITPVQMAAVMSPGEIQNFNYKDEDHEKMIIARFTEYWDNLVFNENFPFYFIPQKTYALIEQNGGNLYDKLRNIAVEAYNTNWEDKGVILFDEKTFIKTCDAQGNTLGEAKDTGFVYTMKGNVLTLVLFYKHSLCKSLTFKVDLLSSETYWEFFNKTLAPESLDAERSELEEEIKDSSLMGKLAITLITFIHFFETQKVVVNVNKKPRANLNEIEYLNLTPRDVHIIDSSWFTTIIRNDPFLVKGHFRLQPYGEKLAHRKIIWIQEFTKKGYTRRAAKDIIAE